MLPGQPPEHGWETMVAPEDLRHCEGFLSFGPGERCGVVQRVLFSQAGEPEALTIRLGPLTEAELVVADVRAVDRCVTEHGHVYLRRGWRERFARPPVATEDEAAGPLSCTLAYALGRLVDCTGDECPFWREGGRRCPLASLEPELHLDPAAARVLLTIRDRLASNAE